jgi:pyruvate dehydrogenase E2 component (dihydrolipoamide acetyltransferase)
MSHVIVMPAVSPTMTHGTLVQCLKRVGESVVPGDVVAEIESDKSIVELQAEVAGVVEAWLVAEGTEDVPVNTPLLHLADSDALDTRPASAIAPPAFATQANKTIEAKPTASNQASQAATPPAPALGATVDLSKGLAPAASPALATPATSSTSTLAANPSGASASLGQAIARQLGIAPPTSSGNALALLDAIGPAMRVNTRVAAAPRDSRVETDNDAQAAAATSNTAADAVRIAQHLGTAHHLETTSRMRRTIATRLTRSKREAPHFYLNVECTVDALIAYRQELNARVETQRISVNDLLVTFAARALRAHPQVNMAWAESELVHFDQVDVAVAMATPNGLLTPVVRHADQKSVDQMAATLRSLGQQAHAGTLPADASLGGSTTLSNLGMYGVREAVAVLNPPQASILAIGASQTQAIVHEGVVRVGQRMRVSMSVDHRAIDGAIAARFLSELQAMIESPRSALAPA